MRFYKSERLKKLEIELGDLEQWLKLGLVPKKDVPKHQQEIEDIRGKIEEEKERIQFLRESGEYEEYSAPKRTPTRAGYTEMPSLPDIDAAETATAGQDTNYEMSTDQTEGDNTIADEKGSTTAEEDEHSQTDEDEESYFSDRARWRRGGIRDPDADVW